MSNKLIPCRRDLKEKARELRKNQTPAEKEIWDKIRKKSLGVEFHRQVPLLDYIVDFYCHEIFLAIEIDGPIHDYRPKKDRWRQKRLEAQGVQFLRFSNKDVFTDISSVINSIRKFVEEATSPDDTPP
ncbi:endonuclease domain-containing protein [Sinomicrobium weinanense]|uniref:Endonuclease domain-containing protein n=1 Tax=Sinomicrobium weinanense TaxID=2842200 RepID=A0A926JNI2_9FLAO|nr:DUF559 domain-containing protein [Sinomicrobium weinanense]MBC9794429.1 endonuclease domain-containing protein [Sinomicrobium weinanense]MBU3124336.1 DUF559 domain-containing protein [Sinomicrobium weinanense]